jgi:hypothetical protein
LRTRTPSFLRHDDTHEMDVAVVNKDRQGMRICLGHEYRLVVYS